MMCGQTVRGNAHDKLAGLLKYISLQRRLTQWLGRVGASTLLTNLIFHQGVADILDHPTKLVCILGAAQEPRDLALLCHWYKILEDIVQFAINHDSSD